jgi:hypothetical protein
MAGCKDGKSATPSPSPSKTAKPAENGIAGKSVDEIVTEARSALKQARSVHMKGAFTEAGKRTTMDLRVARDVSEGTVSSTSHGKNAPIYLRRVHGITYTRSPELVRAEFGADAARLVGDKWYYSSKEKTSASPIDDFATPAKMAESLTPEGNVSKGAPTTINGVPVIGLRDSESVLYVATTGTPYPIRVEPDPPKRGEGFDLLDYNVPLSVVAPPGAIDIDDLHG